MLIKSAIGKIRHSIIFKNAAGKELRIIKTTNKISAFDFIFPFEVPNKGKILQMLSVLSFIKTKHIIRNCFVGVLDENHLLFEEAKVFSIEFVVRGYLAGSLYRLYAEKGVKGVYDAYGIYLPQNLHKNQKLPFPILTPTTKAHTGHDIPLSVQNAALQIGKELFSQVANKCIELFEFGTKDAQNHGLVLVDTKYEMGTIDAELVLVDEVHTPDSSRFWIKKDFEQGKYVHLSKEFLREKIISIYNTPEAITKHPAHHPYFQNNQNIEELCASIEQNYQKVYSLFCDDKNLETLIQNHQVPWPILKLECEKLLSANLLPKNILVIGDGGRDFTLATSFANFAEVETVYCACGDRFWENSKFKILSLPAGSNSVLEIAHFAAAHDVGLVIAGPEAPIAQGIAQACEKFNIPVLAPSLECALLETSKILCKQAIVSAGIKTPYSEIFSLERLESAIRTDTLPLPCVIKYDSLAQGKGVFVVETNKACLKALAYIKEQLPTWDALAQSMLTKTYSKQMNAPHFLVEERIEGEEISVIALCNDKNFKLLPIARDYKRRDNNQTGPNTGGMGAVSPVSIPSNIYDQVKQIFASILNTLSTNQTPYYGFLFAGFMIRNQEVYLLEFNCRLGDPETQVILPGLSRTFFTEIMRTAKKEPFLYDGDSFEHDAKKRIYVVGASPEYPFTNAPIRKLNYIANQDVHFIPSSIRAEMKSNGGRMFGVLTAAENINLAREKIYSNLSQTTLEDENGIKIKPYYRTDIGQEFSA